MNRNNTAALATIALFLAMPSHADGKGKGMTEYAIYVESEPAPDCDGSGWGIRHNGTAEAWCA